MSNDRAEQLAAAKKKRTMSTDSLLLLQRQDDEKKSKVNSPGPAGSSASTSHRSLARLSLRAQDDNDTEEGGVMSSVKNLSGATTEGNLSTRAVSEDGLLLLEAANNRSSQSSSSEDGSSFDDDRFSSSGENSRTGTPSGNWGWFEDVHASAQTDGGPFLFANTTAAANKSDTDTAGSSGNNSNIKGKDGGMKLSNNTNNYNKRGGGGGGGGGGTKSKGLFDELMQNMLSIVPPQQHHQHQRQEANTMAVTAPTYVLEESLSSQKLWKQTAGNRPPQPVEERAYFEQMWAQNFARSSVKYEIPVEVLTASTPISISPFNDERFMDDENISNYNLAGTFHNVEDTTGGGKGGGGDHDADCIAEAALNQRRQQHQQQRFSGNGAVHMYFDPNRPKEYNLKTLGPHHHHHTLVNKKVNNVNGENTMTVLVRGDNVFGTTVSKSFQRVNEHGEQTNGIDTVSISIASYRVVESKKHGKYAQYLVIFCDGNFRNTIGVWKRYSDFSELSRKVTQGEKSCATVVTGLSPLSVDSDDQDDTPPEILPNAITSWRLLKKRQRWYRCLDANYLSLKVFLLERFLHDILFESSNPQILRDFVSVNSSESSKLNTKG